MSSAITLNVNGQNYSVTVSDGGMPLLWVLRDLIGLTGTKYGCGIEVCGACTVLISLWAGQSVGLVNKVQAAGDIVREIVEEADSILQGLVT